MTVWFRTDPETGVLCRYDDEHPEIGHIPYTLTKPPLGPKSFVERRTLEDANRQDERRQSSRPSRSERRARARYRQAVAVLPSIQNRNA